MPEDKLDEIQRMSNKPTTLYLHQPLILLLDITAEDIERHKIDLLSKVYLETLITGNIGQEVCISCRGSVHVNSSRG